MTRRRSALLCAGIATSLALAACAANTPSGGGDGGSEGSDTLEVVSWWTSGSEAEALQVLFDAVAADREGLQVSNAAVSGGGGANAQQALNARLQAGDPPDTWQLHPDQQLASFVQGGQVADISDLWAEQGWADIVPPDVDEVQQVDGAYYTVPVGVHRGNVLWMNPTVLDEAGVTIDESTDLDGLISALRTVQESGVTPICLGDKEIFAASQLLESVIVAEIGPDNWRALFTGEKPFDDPDVRAAAQKYAELLEMTNADHTALTWDEAALQMAGGACAVTLMGDWALGEIVNGGYEPGTDFTWVPFPGDEPTFIYIGDGFSIPADNIPNAEAAQQWLITVMDPEVQLAFAAIKGSIPAVTTADTSTLSEYQQSAAQDFQSAAIVSSIAHAQAAGAEYSQTFADAVTTFNGNPNIDALLNSLTAGQSILGD
ncbi:MAG: ABC transporter substrate-binding protein [Beutenbergiaceae bacterium]